MQTTEEAFKTKLRALIEERKHNIAFAVVSGQLNDHSEYMKMCGKFLGLDEALAIADEAERYVQDLYR